MPSKGRFTDRYASWDIPNNFSFLPYLRRAIQNLTWKYNPAYSYINTTLGENANVRPTGSMSREFSVAFHNVPAHEGIRDLRMTRLGKLMSISGTVTRTSEVRPELVYGTFTCKDCGGIMHNVEQQFKYTEVGRTPFFFNLLLRMILGVETNTLPPFFLRSL